MADKAVVWRRREVGGEALERDLARVGVRVEHRLAHGELVRANREQCRELERLGYRVKWLPNTHLLTVGQFSIDIESREAPRLGGLAVPEELAQVWWHHLVQLDGPPTPEWMRAIEEHGVEVVEPISAYGLFVVGSPESVRRIGELPFVAWTGPFQPAYRMTPGLSDRTGRIRYVSVGVYPESDADEVRRAIEGANGNVVHKYEAGQAYREGYAVLIAELDASALEKIARLPSVRWLEYRSPALIPDDERSCQIVAERLNGSEPPLTAPVPGYAEYLAKVDLSGKGTVVGICDTGVCNNVDDATMHPDLKGRLTFFVDMTGGQTPVDGWPNPADPSDPNGGHGTHVTGITVGNPASGPKDSQGFLLGQGIAPGAHFGMLNDVAPGASGALANSELTKLMVGHGAQVMNNSWSSGGSVGYSSITAEWDRLVRDPNPDAAGLEKLAIVFAAGNDGPSPKSISEPHEAKNVLVVGSSDSSLAGAGSGIVGNISDSSSRGPAADGRLLPTVLAPGNDVVSTRSTADGDPGQPGIQLPSLPYDDPASGQEFEQYMIDSGTSMAAPHVSGLCSLLIEWWSKRTNGRTPSAALLKALMVNGAEDLGGENWTIIALWEPETEKISRRGNIGFVPTGVVFGSLLKQGSSLAELENPDEILWYYDADLDTLYVGFPLSSGNLVTVRSSIPLPPIPNNDQGWGRASLANMVTQAPDADRGPKVVVDQSHAFTANGQHFSIRVAPVVPNLPMRVTLVWSDSPGAANASPALVNDLDLEVNSEASGETYKGNVFEGGFSTSGGDHDTLNNVECVYVQDPSGVYEVSVLASALKGNALPPFDFTTPWQDFALVIDNAEVADGPPVSIVPVIDRSGSMVTSGYEAVTKAGSKLFVDLMGLDDEVAVVSFSGEGVVQYPLAPGNGLQTIDGQPVRDAAKASVDAIEFGGSTFMADGIAMARDLLQPVSGSRAMVLLSDGYDNKGDDPDNPAKPWAADLAATLPSNMPVYTCAMGPASDQALLEKIADVTKGKYYYMPEIEELTEIYNYIRGAVSGDGIIVNESATASKSSVSAFVESLASAVTFSVSWSDSSGEYVAHPPEGFDDISVRLRMPNGRLLYGNDAGVRRIVGDRYVIFEVREPMAGKWSVEVATARTSHTRYTFAGFVKSPLRLATGLSRTHHGTYLGAAMLHGAEPVRGVRMSMRVKSPERSIAALLHDHREELRSITLPSHSGDGLPHGIARLLTLGAQRPGIFGHVHRPMSVRSVETHRLAEFGLQHLHPGAGGLAHLGRLPSGAVAGSHNVELTVTGYLPRSNSRFVRKELLSVRIEPSHR